MKSRLVIRMPDEMVTGIDNVAKLYKCKKSEVVRRAVNKLFLDVGIDRGEIEYKVDTDGETTYYHAG